MKSRGSTRLLYSGPLWVGSTARHRQEAFGTLPGVELLAIDSGGRVGRSSISDRIRYRLGWPADRTGFNARIIDAAQSFQPDYVVIDSVPVVTPSTLRALRQTKARVLAYYSPDDLSATHIRTRQLAACESLWDVMFTTKTFNIKELERRNVRRPLLAGKSYHPPIHRPLLAAQIGAGFERFDAVLAATFEKERYALLQACARRGISVLVLGGGWEGVVIPDSCKRLPNAWDESYSRTLHFGKVALCPLRRVSRDRITARSIEIPACGRAMLAEKTEEHDEHFVDGHEYISYSSVQDAAEKVILLCADPTRRHHLERAGRARCESSGYSTFARAEWMIAQLKETPPTT